MALVGSLVASVSANTTDFDAGMKRASTSLKELQTHTTQVQETMAGLGRSLTALGAGLAAGLVSLQALKTAFEGVVQSGEQMQRLQSAFVVITGSSDAARDTLNFLRQSADRLGVSFGDLADAYKGLAASTRGTILEGQTTRDLFNAITNARRARGLSTQDVSGILLAFQQIVSKGTVSAEELRGQIGERLPGAFQISARAIGTTTEALDKMLKGGELASTTFVTRIIPQLNKEFGDTANTAATFSQAMARLGNAISDVGALTAQSGFLAWLTAVIEKLAQIVKIAPDATRELEKMARTRVQQQVVPIEQQGLPIPPESRKQMDDLMYQIVKAEERLKFLKEQTDSTFDPTAVLSQERAI